MDERILYNNKFIDDKDLLDIPSDKIKEFEKYYEQLQKKRKDEQAIKRANKMADKVSSNDRDIEYNENDLLTTNSVQVGHNYDHISLGIAPPWLTQQNRQQRTKIEVRSVVNIDSKDRDTALYSEPNHFKINLGKTFRNIKSIKLLSLEFPNTDQVIKSTPESQRNNRLRWQNQEDVGTNYEGVVYTVDISPGNYTALSLSDEISSKLATVKRVAFTGDFHNFQVDINLDTDIVSMTSLVLDVLPNNPISTTNNSSQIRVLHPNHTFSIGDQVYITGIKTTIGGIPSNLINGFQTIVDVPAAQDLTGTVSVTSGTPFVVGSGTIFNTEVIASEIIEINSETKSVVSVGIAVSGLVAVSAGSAVVAGSGTAFSSGSGAAKVSVGDKLVINNETKTVVTVVSDTELTMDGNYSSTASNQTAVRNPDTELLMDSNYAATVSGQTATSPIDSYVFEVSVKALETATGGGNFANAGRGAPFKLLFGQYSDTVASNLGFPLEDSSDDIPGTNQLYSNNIPIVDVTVGTPTVITAYRTLTGTVHVTSGSTYVIGTGTAFSSEVFPLNILTINGEVKRVLRIGAKLSGTVSVTASDSTVTGSGTAFTTEVQVGDIIVINYETHTVTTINSNTELITAANFAASAAGVEIISNPNTVLTMDSAFSATASDLDVIQGHGLRDGSQTLPGSVVVTSGSAVVTGTGTTFTQYIGTGDSLIINGETRVVSSVDSDTQLTMTTNFTNTIPATLTGNVAIANGLPYLVGTGSAFSSEVIAGDVITVSGQQKTVSLVGKHLTGTVSVVSGSAAILGTGTDFYDEVNAGDTLTIDGQTKTVVSVDSTSQITMDSNYSATKNSRLAILNPNTILTMNSDYSFTNSGLSASLDRKAAVLSVGQDSVMINNLVTIPSIIDTTDGVFAVENVNAAGTSFEINYSTNSVNSSSFASATVGSERMRVYHQSHGLSTGNVIRLYRAVEISGIHADDINNKALTIRVINSDNYEADFGVYATSRVLGGGGTNLRISSRLHGFSEKQTNTSDGTNLNRSISLEGLNYVLMTSPGLDTVLTTNGSIKDVFAKILLLNPPGTMQFNSFISNAKIFHQDLLPELFEMEFSILAPDGTYFQFNDIDYSFSLEIIEYVDILTSSGFNSRRGIEEIAGYNELGSQPPNLAQQNNLPVQKQQPQQSQQRLF